MAWRTGGRRHSLDVLLRGLGLVAVALAVGRGADLPRLALGLEVAHLLDEDAVDVEQRGHAVLGARLRNGRGGRGGHGAGGRVQLGLERRLRGHRERRVAVGGEGGRRVRRGGRGRGGRSEAGRSEGVVGGRPGGVRGRVGAGARDGVGGQLLLLVQRLGCCTGVSPARRRRAHRTAPR